MARPYAVRQESYWRRQEWEFLDQAVNDPDVQGFLAKNDHDKARGLLAAQFRLKFDGPVEGETDADFKKRLRGTSKARKALVSRRTTETREQWETRMVTLPDEIQTWLKTWRSRNKRQEGKQWVPPPLSAPSKRKRRATTAFEVFCKSAEAPQGQDYVTADGRRRCDVPALQAARKVAWDELSHEKQERFREAAIDMDAESDLGTPGQDDGVAKEDTSQPVAHAQDIAIHVDQFVTTLHESVNWGGFAVFGGPDERGEARIHVTGAGTNRHGQTFFDAFLQTVGWTQLEFETVFALWVEQCREGPQQSENSTFAHQARQAIEYANANRHTLLVTGGPSAAAGVPLSAVPPSAAPVPPSAAGVLMCSRAIRGWMGDPDRVTTFPVMNFDTLDAAGQVNHALLNGIAALKSARSHSGHLDGERAVVSQLSEGAPTSMMSQPPHALSPAPAPSPPPPDCEVARTPSPFADALIGPPIPLRAPGEVPSNSMCPRGAENAVTTTFSSGEAPIPGGELTLFAGISQEMGAAMTEVSYDPNCWLGFGDLDRGENQAYDGEEDQLRAMDPPTEGTYIARAPISGN